MGFFDRFRPSKQKVRVKSRKKAAKKTNEPEKALPGEGKRSRTEKDELAQWQSLVKNVQSHPLSQAGIINTQLLEQLTNVLDSISCKLDDLKKLDEILELLKAEKTEMEASGKHSERLDRAIAELERATIKDRDAVELLRKGAMTADHLAAGLKLSRSTASSRLNRLYSLGAVDKYAEGKKIYYKIRD